MSSIRIIVAQSIIVVFLLEVGSFLASSFGLFLVNETPKLYTDSAFTDILYGRTEEKEWGAWHKENQTFRHAASCFDITMNFNEVGARDEPFQSVPNNSVMLLGDSFAEGYGVSYEDTSQFLLERKINRRILNFGAAGNFGPLQELILYQRYRQTYPHSAVFVYVLPANDFTDNDANIWRKIDQRRYRPYFSVSTNPLEPIYFADSKKRDSFGNNSNIQIFIKENFWLSNALRTALMLTRKETLSKNKEISKSFYFNSTLEQQKNLIAAYSKIAKLAGDKKVIFVIIPDQADILRYRSFGNDKSYREQFWSREFVKLSAMDNIHLIDLMDYIPTRTDALFFTCDVHWSPEGNRWAADSIYEYLTNHNIFTDF